MFRTSSGSGSLRVQVLFRGLFGGVLGLIDGATLSGSPGWEPSATLLNLASLTVPLGTTSFELRFTPVGGDASWRVDDVYVDPWASRD